MIVAFWLSTSGLVAERLGRFESGRAIPSLTLPEQLVPSTVDVMASERKAAESKEALSSSEREPAMALEEFSTAIAALRGESGDSHYNAAKMLQRVCENAAQHPDEDKYRRIRCSNPAFVKHLDRFEASRACLTIVGFREETAADGTAQLMLPRAEVSRPLLSAVSELLKGELRMLDVQKSWPSALRASLPAAATTLALHPSLLDALTQELTAPHVPTLLEHGDNAQRVTEQMLRGEESATALIEQLREVRENVTSAPQPLASVSRVREVQTAEEWYDLIMDTPGLVVAYFGAKWCKPCELVKPLYASLSSQSKFASVTFVQIDTDELPLVSSECEIAQLPTFKFFRDATEDDLPIVGADIVQLESRLDQML
jgi:thioredoxin 1